MLEGSARRWYRTVARSVPFRSWADFVSQFLKDFEPAHQQERLLETIKKRIQKPDEGVVKFIIYMEDLFLRLPDIPSEQERIRIIRKNLLPRYARALALHRYDSVLQLKEACSCLEAMDENLQSRSRNNPSFQRDRGFSGNDFGNSFSRFRVNDTTHFDGPINRYRRYSPSNDFRTQGQSCYQNSPGNQDRDPFTLPAHSRNDFRSQENGMSPNRNFGHDFSRSYSTNVEHDFKRFRNEDNQGVRNQSRNNGINSREYGSRPPINPPSTFRQQSRPNDRPIIRPSRFDESNNQRRSITWSDEIKPEPNHDVPRNRQLNRQFVRQQVNPGSNYPERSFNRVNLIQDNDAERITTSAQVHRVPETSSETHPGNSMETASLGLDVADFDVSPTRVLN